MIETTYYPLVSKPENAKEKVPLFGRPDERLGSRSHTSDLEKLANQLYLYHGTHVMEEGFSIHCPQCGNPLKSLIDKKTHKPTDMYICRHCKQEE